jgi:hypothetical protein
VQRAHWGPQQAQQPRGPLLRHRQARRQQARPLAA